MLNMIEVSCGDEFMDIKEEISSFKSMINSYKLTNLIIAANNVGIFNCLSENVKNIEQIAKELDVISDRIEPIWKNIII